MTTFVNPDSLELPAIPGPFDPSKPGYLKLMVGDDGHLYLVDEAGGTTRVTLQGPESVVLEKLEAAFSASEPGEILGSFSIDGLPVMAFHTPIIEQFIDLPLAPTTPAPAPEGNHRFYVDYFSGVLGRLNSAGDYDRVSISQTEKDIVANIHNALENGADGQVLSLNDDQEAVFIDLPVVPNHPFTDAVYMEVGPGRTYENLEAVNTAFPGASNIHVVMFGEVYDANPIVMTGNGILKIRIMPGCRWRWLNNFTKSLGTTHIVGPGHSLGTEHSGIGGVNPNAQIVLQYNMEYTFQSFLCTDTSFGMVGSFKAGVAEMIATVAFGMYRCFNDVTVNSLQWNTAVSVNITRPANVAMIIHNCNLSGWSISVTGGIAGSLNVMYSEISTIGYTGTLPNNGAIYHCKTGNLNHPLEPGNFSNVRGLVTYPTP